MEEKRQEVVMHESTQGKAQSFPIRPWEKGDAPEARVAYLEGVLLQDGQFISHGKCFFIHDEPSDQCVTPDTLYVRDE